ncbi:putative ABC transporter ATP-binding protein [Halalkalicoccus paucihalophilus]|uniref:Putative ABC transporter ATP-binding protein n=2 Tax=Halalkalicoccus paucihalophilus TaxID=1008153 RepID=A0A151A8Q2_9EURY|nr:putative ABC transporter ATP-binding protein [Halalkalicoccus paucihalophilus]
MKVRAGMMRWWCKMSDPILEFNNVDIEYQTRGDNAVHAVNDATFTIDEHDYFGLVGESGCGKSTIADAIVGGLDDNGEISSGTIRYKGTEIQNYSESQFNKEIRWKEISVIPQSSMNSLDPVMKLSQQAVEIAKYHTDLSKAEAIDRLRELFDVVGLSESRIHDYPHQFSGGMQQRAIIAFSLFLQPSLIIADEPTTALDVIMQDQILDHINSLKEEWEISMLMITHDISVVFENCDTMAVMHGGQIAEAGNVVDLFDRPRHPYAILLQNAFPDVRYPDRELAVIEGHPPQLREKPDFCTFADRCPWSIAECYEGAPDPQSVEGDEDHQAWCIRANEMDELAADHLTKPAEGRSILEDIQ